MIKENFKIWASFHLDGEDDTHIVIPRFYKYPQIQ